LKSPIAREITSTAAIDPWRQVSAPLLAASIVLMGFWVVGTRAMFSLPLELPANWIFRMMPLRAGPECLFAMRRSLWVLSVAPALLLSSIVFLACWPWQAALEHLVLLALAGLTITELSLLGNQKIPFTCSWLPGKSNLHIAFWICIMLVLEIVLRLADLEVDLVKNPWHWSIAVVVLAAIVAAAALRASRSAKNECETLRFEEIPSWELTRLNLP
jgi:hypothetical protein